MALEQLLQALRDVNGYKASAIMNYTGEALAVDSVDPEVDLGLVGATFNDIFRAAHEASRKIGLEATREAVFKTPKGLVIMQCSGVDAKVHIHAVMVLNADGNQALAKMRLDQVVPKVMAEI
jgi:predicted regulator of Ras-like GTPase activity (Roadblock/LC7/MglB family)